MNKSKFLLTGIEAVKEAQKIVLKYFDTNLNIDTKKDGSPVTIADRESEQIIRKIITSAFPDHGFIGEEYGDSQKKSKYTWVIDPIDGTKNYSRNIPLFATELALFEDEELILGISNAPLLKKFVYAQKGQGAYLNETQKIQVSKVDKIKNAYISIGSLKYFKKLEILNKLVKINEDCAGMKGFGDTWSYQFVAEGKLDAIIEAKLKIWDIAAVLVIIQEAGGKVTDIDGNKITTKSTSALASNGKLHQILLDYLA